MKDKRALDVHDLDRVSTDHPVSVRHRGGHTTYYNSKALALAGITKETPNTKAGTFDRDAKGELNGRVTDRARLVFAKAGMRPTYSAEETRRRNRDGLAFISKQFVRYGLTSVHHEGGDLLALQEIRARGDLRHRVSYEPMDDVLEGMIAHGIATGFGDEWIRLGATSEHTCDGSFSERTMAMSKPYDGVEPAYYGNILTTQADLDAWVERVHRAGIEVNCHANGDVTIDMVLTALERAQRLDPRPDARPKITHCTLINDDLLRRIKAVGAVPAPFTSYAYYNSDKFHFYGEELNEALHGVPLLRRCRHSGRRGLRLQPRAVRAADGHSGHGDAHGMGRQDLGRRAADHRRPGAAGHDDQRRLRLARRGDQGLDHAGQARRLRGAGGRSPHRAAGQDQGHHHRRDGGRRKHGVPSVGGGSRSPNTPIPDPIRGSIETVCSRRTRRALRRR